MDPILNHIKEDLICLYNEDIIKSAVLLNNKLKRNFISENCKPMYFTGKFDAKTVFVMLNPGASGGNYSFKNNEKSKYTDFNDFFHKQVNHLINYGYDDRDRLDNFDLKQAAFLFGFKDSGIDIPDFFKERNRELMLKAKENVLMQKLQLELVPYLSIEFVKVFDSHKLAKQNIEFFTSHIERILDAIVYYERKYVIFGAKQFYYLFQAYQELGYGNVEFGTEQGYKIDGLQKKVYFNTMKISHKGNEINAGISYSFPRRDLPNAYEKMRKYGELCYQEMLNVLTIR